MDKESRTGLRTRKRRKPHRRPHSLGGLFPALAEPVLRWKARTGALLAGLARGLVRLAHVGAFLLVLLAAAMTVGFIHAAQEAGGPGPTLDRGTMLLDLTTIQETFGPKVCTDANQMSASVSSTPFPDLPIPPANGVLRGDIMKGFPDGTFKAEVPVTRGEGITFLARLLRGLPNPGPLSRKGQATGFKDVSQRHWLAKDLNLLADFGLTGLLSWSELAPDRPLTRAEWASLTAPLHPAPPKPEAIVISTAASEAALLPSETRALLKSFLTPLPEESPMEDDPAPTVDPAGSFGAQPAETEKSPESSPTAPLLTPVPIEGFIVDGLSGRRLPQATMLIGSHTVILQSDAAFRVPGYRDQLLEMTAYCEGYQPLTLKHRVGFKPGPVVFGLKPAHTVFQGEVIDGESGLPIAGAALTIGTRKIVADATGRFRLPGLSPTWHQIVCRAPGFMDSVELIYLKTGEPSRILRLRPERGVSAGSVGNAPQQRSTVAGVDKRPPTMDIPSQPGYSEYLSERE